MDKLPEDIIIKILGYLTLPDAVEFCEAFKCRRFLKDRLLTTHVNLSRAFHMPSGNIRKLLNKSLNPEYITSLNINSLYYISKEVLIKALNKMGNLEKLFAVDTQLGVDNPEVYSKLPKLSQLAITLEHVKFKTPLVSSLKSLYLKVIINGDTISHQEDLHLFSVFGKRSLIEELWLNVVGDMYYQILPSIMTRIKKLVLKTVWSEHSFKDLQRTFVSGRTDDEIHMVFEKIPETEEYSSNVEPGDHEPLKSAWKTINDLARFPPCGPKDQRSLFLNVDVSQIYFEDLVFDYQGIVTRYNEAVEVILKSPNASKLKRLQLRSCFFNPSARPYKPKAKKTRHEDTFNPNEDLFTNCVRNLKHLSELELFTCSNSCSQVYQSIGELENLEKLSMEISPEFDGSFLKNVFMKCQNLWSLRLNLKQSNPVFIAQLAVDIKNSSSLKDFCLKTFFITVDNLFGAFNAIQYKKLQRVFIHCEILHYNTKYQPFSRFLECNPQLSFLLLVAANNLTRDITRVQCFLDEYKNEKRKMYLITDNPKPQIPLAHHDLVYERSNVSGIHFDDFGR